jgi:uncharacterized SAM-binding protein YcdF (DUF218 family)
VTVAGETAVVVLGLRLREDVSGLSEELRGRVEVAVDAFEELNATWLVPSGARTNPAVSESEAAAMAAHAVELGVDRERILLEARAEDTIGNAYYARRLLEERDDLAGVTTVAVVSSCYHGRRAAYVFGKCLGPSYDLRIEYCHDTGRSREETYEADALAASRELLSDVAPGDLDGIYARLDAAPAYDYDLSPPGAVEGELRPSAESDAERPTDYSKR